MDTIGSIGNRIEEERTRLNLSQSQVAEVAKNFGVPGATRQSQARYEKGQATPSAAYVAAITTLGFDALYVLTGMRNAPVAPMEQLTMREKHLLANYRGSDEIGKKAVETTASAVSHRESGKQARSSK